MFEFMKKNDKKKDKQTSLFFKVVLVLIAGLLILICINFIGNSMKSSTNGKDGFELFPNFRKALYGEEKTTHSENEPVTDIKTERTDDVDCSEDDFKLETVNVGQGLNLIMSCKGDVAMYDGGEYSFRMNKEYVDSRNEIWDKYSYFKYVFLSHYDSDHAGGLMDVIYNKQIGKFIKPRYRAYTKTYSNIKKALKDKKIKSVKAKAKKIYRLGDAKIKILKAEKKSYDENDNSIVLKVTHGNVSYMITGDLTNYGEYQLTKYKSTEEQLPSSVLVVGHHGSASSSCNDFIHRVSPIYSVISVGANNKYGHPSDSTLTLLRSYKSRILRTDEIGTITMWDDGDRLYVKK